jgi:bifunctional UDP-N-acetylglucosamine pyrophosphorylase/glucosamine-1-phosphate N-acetyltransferase
MVEGVRLADPSRIDVRGKLVVGRDVRIDINAVFEGKVVLADNVSIGPNCVLKDCEIGEGSQIEAFSHIQDSVVGADCQIGPYARLRPGTNLEQAVKIGNFVEVKKTQIGKGSKVNHLSYIGDAHIGEGVNIGAGTITCNYDGVNKFKTEIHNGVFVGSNSSLVAPLVIGEGVTIGAGSTITKSVDSEHLAIARGKQRNISGWQKPSKK